MSSVVDFDQDQDQDHDGAPFLLLTSYFISRFSLACILYPFCLSIAIHGLNGADHLSLVWSDEFEYTGLPDSSKWGYDVGGHGWGNRESQYYTQNREQNARVENGVLVIEARREAFGGRNYTSARVISKNKGDWKYGRFEIRAKLPRGRGTWPAIWMLPTDWVYGGWPNSGEIDIMEHVGYDMHHIHGSIHTGRFNHLLGTQISSSLQSGNVDTEFHVYAMEWRPDRIDIFLDGQRYFTVSDDGSGSEAWPFDQRFHLLMNIAVGGSWGGVQGVDNSIFPQRMEIDYVRVYSIEDSDPSILHTVPGRVEAEDFSDQSGIRLEQTRDAGGGSNAGYLENGDWAEYPLDVTIPGRYAFDLRYASQNGAAGVELSVNGEIVETFQPFTSTGYWQNWKTQRLTELELPKGKINLRISALAPPQQSALNYNWIDLVLLQPDGLTEPFSDPDGDGISNFFEYAFALDPSENTSPELLPFGYTVKKPNGTYVGITYRQRVGGTGRTGIDYTAAAVTYRVEDSGDLAEDSWKTIATLLNTIGEPRDNGDGTETVSVEFAFPIDVGRRFLRLKLIAEGLN